MTPEAQRVAIAEACGWRWVAVEHPRGLHHPRGGMVKALFSPQWNTDGWHASDGSERECHEEWVIRRTPQLPDYLNDLNAIHGACLSVFDDSIKRLRFHRELSAVVSRGTPNFPGYDVWDAENAAAAQRAEAFLRAIGKWDDAK